MPPLERDANGDFVVADSYPNAPRMRALLKQARPWVEFLESFFSSELGNPRSDQAVSVKEAEQQAIWAAFRKWYAQCDSTCLPEKRGRDWKAEGLTLHYEVRVLEIYVGWLELYAVNLGDGMALRRNEKPDVRGRSVRQLIGRLREAYEEELDAVLERVEELWGMRREVEEAMGGTFVGDCFVMVRGRGWGEEGL
jgi:hypothetical protein